MVRGIHEGSQFLKSGSDETPHLRSRESIPTWVGVTHLASTYHSRTKQHQANEIGEECFLGGWFGTSPVQRALRIIKLSSTCSDVMVFLEEFQ